MIIIANLQNKRLCLDWFACTEILNLNFFLKQGTSFGKHLKTTLGLLVKLHSANSVYPNFGHLQYNKIDYHWNTTFKSTAKYVVE